MLRWLILGAALAFILIGLRRALLGRGRESGPGDARPGKNKPSKQLVCAKCGTKYDSESGWACPKCGG